MENLAFLCVMKGQFELRFLSSLMNRLNKSRVFDHRTIAKSEYEKEKSLNIQ